MTPFSLLHRSSNDTCRNSSSFESDRPSLSTATKKHKISSLPWRFPRAQKSNPSLLAGPQATLIHASSVRSACPPAAFPGVAEAVEEDDAALGSGYVFAPTARRRPKLPSVFVPAPRPRPVSAAGSLASINSARSGQSARSSLEADSIRRRSALMDDRAFVGQLQRASDVLRASERGRIEHDRKAARRIELDHLQDTAGQATIQRPARRGSLTTAIPHARTLSVVAPHAPLASSSQESVGLPRLLALHEPASKFSNSTGKVSYASPTKLGQVRYQDEPALGGTGGKGKGKALRHERSFKNLLGIKADGGGRSLRGLFGGEARTGSVSGLTVRNGGSEMPRSILLNSGRAPTPSTSSHTKTQSTSSATTSARPSSEFSSSKESYSTNKSVFSKWSSVIKGRRVRKKVAQFEAWGGDSPAVVATAAKVAVAPQPGSPVLATRPPSRIPLSSVFPGAAINPPAPQAVATGVAPPRPRPAPRLSIPPGPDLSRPATSIPRPNPSRKPSLVRHESQFATFSAPGMAPRNLAAQFKVAGQAQASRSAAHHEPGSLRIPATATGALLPPAAIRTSASDSLLRAGQRPLSSSDESSYGDDRTDLTPPSPLANRGSWRSPSPARFRDLLPSESAASSPDKNALDLPVPECEGSPRPSSDHSSPGGGGRKRAMGPEQVIAMVDSSSSNTSEIAEVSCATTDLADLLSGLEDNDTMDVGEAAEVRLAVPEFNAEELSASLRRYLPKQRKQHSITSSDSSILEDVPDDLRDMIRAVKNHILDLPLELPSPPKDFSPESSSPGAFTTTHLMPAHFGTGLSPSSGEPTKTFLSVGSETIYGRMIMGDSTAGSYEGCVHATTAAGALAAMLGGAGVAAAVAQGDTAELELRHAEDNQSCRLRDSARDALEVGRPSVGDKMLDSHDVEVSLTSLIAAVSPPASAAGRRASLPQRPLGSHAHSVSLTSSEISHSSASHGGSSMSHGSPLAGKTDRGSLRHSMARYSQRKPAVDILFARKRTPATLDEETELNEFGSEGECELDREQAGHSGTDDTSLSLAQSMLSVGSSAAHGSPVPVKKGKYPMLTSRKPMAAFKFPPPPPPPAPSAAAVPTQPPATSAASPPWPIWTRTGSHESQSPTKGPAEQSSPFKRAFNPLEHFKNKTFGSSTEEAVASPLVPSVVSPRFVRPLRLSRPGEDIPAPRPLSVDDLAELIPPDTPPPSSPSTQSGAERAGAPMPVGFEAVAAQVEAEGLAATVTVRVRQTGHRRGVLTNNSISLMEDVIQEEPAASCITATSPVGLTAEAELDASCRPQHLQAEDEPPSPPQPQPLGHLQPHPEPVEFTTLDEDFDPLDRFADESVSDSSSDDSDDQDSGQDSTGWVAHSAAGAAAIGIHFVPGAQQSQSRLASSDSDSDRAEWERDEDEDGTHAVDDTVWRHWTAFRWEAAQELADSKLRWPDTDYSREVMLHWTPPAGLHATLELLFASQNAFATVPVRLPSQSFPPEHGALPMIAAGFYTHSPDSTDLLGRIEAELARHDLSSDENELPHSFGLEVDLLAFPPRPSSSTRRQARVPLGPKPATLNHAFAAKDPRIASLARSASSPSKLADVTKPSPFTALPPKLNLGGKLRGVRAKLRAGLAPSPDKRAALASLDARANGVRLGFLGEQATVRRQGQYDAALRRLEGLGTPDEQRSEGESEGDESGVFEARGEGREGAGAGAGGMDEGFFGFVAKTPKMSSTRPRVGPRTKGAVAGMR